ncbi:sodium-dependent glucose transporter 1-like [Tropilaelaps mercedesae]|uniref:Sodium-dependent glucose transporter 1-like n=1 Tax=Tropilaelaps mercedesae TaxID=418985 RepID=A0A1V9X0P6_9ACAR|nr:sodium-dependent glucose transporter 1-like [Tropilaelaps mercedesae]
MGCVFGLTGASLLDLGDIYVASPKVVSYTMMTRGMGSIAFCLLAGTILQYTNIQHMMIISLLIAGMCVALTPLLGKLAFCHVAMFFLGGTLGLLEIGSNGWIIGLWQEKSGTIFQFFNFCFGLGGVLAPFMAEPFLSQVHSRTNGIPVMGTGINASAEAVNVNVEILPYIADTRVYIPYLLLGGLFFLNTAFMITSYVLNTNNISPGDSTNSDSTCSRRCELTIVTAFCVYVFLIVSLEQTYISMLAVYVVENEQLSFSKSNSAYVSAVFWFSFTVTRVVSTFASLCMQPRSMLFICHSICLLGAAGLAVAGKWSPITVWICSGLMGSGVSPMFATSLSHIMQYVLLSHTYMSFVMLCVCAGGMMPALLVGPYIEEEPRVFLFVNLTQAVLAEILMLFIVIFTRGKAIRPSMIK